MNNENKPLTAEEIQKQGNEWACKMMDKYFPDIDCVDPMWRRIADLYMHAYTESYKVGKEYAAQQTAEKDARIKELEEQLEAVKKERDQLRTEVRLLKKDVFSAIRDTGDLHTKVSALKKQMEAAAKFLETEITILGEVFEEAEGAIDFQGTASHDTAAEAEEWDEKWKTCMGRLKNFLASLQTIGQDVSPSFDPEKQANLISISNSMFGGIDEPTAKEARSDEK